MRLNSLSYRVLWKVKQFLGLRNTGPQPIVWNTSTTSYTPPEDWTSTLDDEEKKRLARLLEELKVLSQIFTYMPRAITREQWAKLLRIDSTRERFYEIKFIRKKESEKEKDMVRKLERTAEQERRAKNPAYIGGYRMFQGYIGAGPIMDYEKILWGTRYCRSLQLEETPKLIIDCRFLPLHSHSGLCLTLKQISMLLSKNRERLCPWPVYLTNFDEANSDLSKLRKSHLGIMDNQIPAGQLTSRSYLAMFPQLRESGKLVYLSPHSTENLERIEANACYVIGGIVDRIIEPKIAKCASLITAEEEGIPCKRLPLDKYMEWRKECTQYLTINSVANIMQEVFDSGGDWKGALERNIPVRKLKAYQPNRNVKPAYEKRREYNRQVMHLLIETLGEEESPGVNGELLQSQNPMLKSNAH